MNAIVPIKLDCSTCPARAVAACGTCADTSKKTLNRISTKRKIAAHSTILHAGDTPKYLKTIVRGVVASIALLGDGRTQILSLHFKGDIIGKTLDTPYVHEFVAMTDVELCLKPRTEFSRLIDDDKGLRYAFLNDADLTLEQSRTWMIALGRKNARERVATFLTFLVSRGVGKRAAPHKNLELKLPLTRVEIGDFLGMSLETVSRQFSALRKAGIIDGKGREIEILDIKGLLAEACEDDSRILW